MKNEYMRPSDRLSLPVPAGTKAGEPVVVGVIAGVAATDAGKGGNAATHASVVKDGRSYLLEVSGKVEGPGSPVWLTPRSGASAPTLSTVDPGGGARPWGYTVPKVGETGARTGTTGVVAVRPRQVP